MSTNHRVPTEADEHLAAVHHQAASDEWVVYCHGFISDKSGSYERRCERAVAAGYNAVRFDFRGCGASNGAFVDQTLASKIADLCVILDYFEVDDAVVFGSSFGAKTALHAAVEDDRIRAVAGRAPVTYNRSFGGKRAAVEADGEFQYETGHTIDERFFEVYDRYPFADVAANLSIPVALFHGTDDESVPLRDSLDAVAALQTDVLLQSFHGEGHRFSSSAEQRTNELFFDWLARHQ